MGAPQKGDTAQIAEGENEYYISKYTALLRTLSCTPFHTWYNHSVV